jgi:signal transduction histidine kinase/ActR/RegA family two-component response regulator
MFEPPDALLGVARDGDGELWIGSARGLWRARSDGAPLPVALGGPGIARPLRALPHADGGVWAPVPGVGLGYLRGDWRALAQIIQGPPHGLTDGFHAAVTPARRGGAWFGGRDGALERVDASGTIERLAAQVRERLRGVPILAVAEDATGRLWVGRDRGLLRIARDGAVVEWTHDDARDPALHGGVHELRVAPGGDVWLAGRGGAVQWRDASGAVRARQSADGPRGHGIADIEALELDAHGRAWIAGDGGVARWDAVRGRFVRVRAMGPSRVHGLAFDDADVAWLQRVTGLERFQRAAGRWMRTARAGPAEGLPAVEGAALRVDGQHRVWLSTPRGLYRWDPRIRAVRRFGVQHGLGSQEFVDGALALGDDGMLAASTVDGTAVLVDTRMPDARPATPPLRIDSVAVRRDGRWHEWPAGQPVELTPGDDEFRVRARLLAFDDPKAHRYWSRLDRHDHGWVKLDAGAERVFTGLSPGRYALRFRAIDATGQRATDQVLRFRVLPPWWRTGGAMAAWIGLAWLLGWLGVRAWNGRRERAHALRLVEHERRVAQEASLAKSHFLATLGHEVRTPMTGVLGMAELLLGTGLDVRQRGYAESIRSAGEHLLRLVDQALDLSRIEAGRLELHVEPFDLHALVGEVAALCGPIAAARGLDFACHVGAEVPSTVDGDALRVRQVVLNLLGNAIKFTERGGVRLEVGHGSHGVCLAVRDTGPGLTAEQRSRLFQRYEQADGARTTARYGGSGLGLAICQELVAAMGGRIFVESIPGVGSCFSVELPLAVSATAAPPAGAPTSAGRGRRILLVEDDATVAAVICNLLRAHGHDVRHAAHALLALAETAGRTFDLVLLDLDLPGLDGLSLARQLRLRGIEAPLLAVTARTDPLAETLAMAAGFQGFLRKPVSGAALEAAIAALHQIQHTVSSGPRSEHF